MNMMVKSNLISEKMGRLWKENSDYLPFYREFYDDEGVLYQVTSPDGAPSRQTLFESLDNDNNKFFPSFQNLKQPKELKGGRPSFRVMVGDVADTKTFLSMESAKQRAQQLKELNQGTGRKVYIAASSQRIRDGIVHTALGSRRSDRRIGLAARLGSHKSATAYKQPALDAPGFAPAG